MHYQVLSALMINDGDCDDDKSDPEANQASNFADVESDVSDSYFKDSSEISKNTKQKKILKKEKLKMKYFYFEKNWWKKFSRLEIPLNILIFGKKILTCSKFIQVSANSSQYSVFQCLY